MYSKVLSGALHGVEGRLITVEADVSEGLPVFNMVGFLASEVREASDRVRTALKNSGYRILPKRITVNLSPADLRKEGSAFDLPISIALLAAYGYLPEESIRDILFIGELSLNGDIRGVRGILSVVDFARQQGIRRIILPFENRREASLVPGMEIYGVKNLRQTVEHLMENRRLTPEKGNRRERENISACAGDFSDIRGQQTLKRATEIGVAGMHNMLYLGPPGAGKSMIAKRIPGIMPPLSHEESIELTKIYSVSGLLPPEEGLIWERPFRAPHHSVTAQALIGGGKIPRPGEISLAHCGILFLDEFLEFQKNIIEMMRQPLEDGYVTISRLQGSYRFPCKIMLVAAMNPCPCGYYPDLQKCRCTAPQIGRYLNKLSQPLLDRFDMSLSVRRVEYRELYGGPDGEASEEIRKRVCRAKRIQEKRLSPYGIHFNSQIPANRLEEFCGLGREEKKLQKQAFEKYGLSARGAGKVLRVARTIADLEGEAHVDCRHLSEALSYRMSDFQKGGGE